MVLVFLRGIASQLCWLINSPATALLGTWHILFLVYDNSDYEQNESGTKNLLRLTLS